MLHAAHPPASLALPAGARVGVVSLLDPEVTHFHTSRQIENSFLKTYTVTWPVDTMLLAAVRERLGQLGLTSVPVVASDALRRARESCFLDASLAKGANQISSLEFKASNPDELRRTALFGAARAGGDVGELVRRKVRRR